MASFSATTANLGGAAVDERADGLVCAGRVLDQEQQHRFVADGDALEPAERGAEASEAGDDLVSSRSQRVRERGGADSVVDVVQPGELELDAPHFARQIEVEGDALECVQLDVAGSDVQLRPGDVAVGAAVVAEVADVRGRVLQRHAAA